MRKSLSLVFSSSEDFVSSVTGTGFIGKYIWNWSIYGLVNKKLAAWKESKKHETISVLHETDTCSQGGHRHVIPSLRNRPQFGYAVLSWLSARKNLTIASLFLLDPGAESQNSRSRLALFTLPKPVGKYASLAVRWMWRSLRSSGIYINRCCGTSSI